MALKYIRMFDLFGASHQFTIFNKGTQYKSVFGGISSVTITLICLIYTVWILFRYADGQFIPNISQISEPVSIVELNSTQSPFSFQIEQALSQFQLIDPFNPQSNIIVPSAIIWREGQLKQIFLQPKQDEDGRYSIKVDNFSLREIGKNDLQNQLFIIYTKCNEQTKPQNWTCANQSKIDLFEKAHTILRFTQIFNLNQYDTRRQEITNVKKLYTLNFDINNLLFQQIYLQTTQLTVGSGFLSQYKNNYQLLSDFKVISQTLSQDYFKSLHLPNITPLNQTYAAFIFKIDPIQVKQQIQYIFFDTILASIGSVVNILFLFGYVVRFVNSQYLNQLLLIKLEKIYFPLTQKHCNSVKYLLTTKKDDQNDRLQKLQKKFELLNLYYVISRLELILDKISDKQVNLARSYGYDIENQMNSSQNSELVINQELEALTWKQAQKKEDDNSILQLSLAPFERFALLDQKDDVP